MPAPAGAIVGLLPLYLHSLAVRACRRPRDGVPLEIVYVLVDRLSDGEPDPAFLRQADRPGAARICCIPVLFGLAVGVLLLANFPMEMLVGLSLAYLASIPLQHAAARSGGCATPGRLARAALIGAVKSGFLFCREII